MLMKTPNQTNTLPSPTTPKRGSTLIWLAYTAFLFIEPAFTHHHRLALWLGTLTSLSLFLIAFTIYIRTQNERTRRWMILATMVLGLATFPWNNGASTYFVYVAAFIPFQFPSVRTTLQLFAAEIACIAVEWISFRHADPQFQVPWQGAVFAVFLMLVIGGSNIYFAEQKRADLKLRAAQEENVALAALAERERIARDLHDVLGHTLSVIVLKAELAGRLLEREAVSPNQARAREEINDVERITRSALAEVREAIGGYRARGLQAEIDAARKTLDAAGVTLRLEEVARTSADQCSNEAERTPTAALPAAEETVLALALREAVTNIVRHAHASTCTLRFAVQPGEHRLTIEDDGQHGTLREGNGLRGMRERVEALGGSLALDCSHGTRLQITLPRAAITPPEPNAQPQQEPVLA